MNDAIRIKDLFRLKEFQNADIISTQQSLNKEISVVTIMDLPNIADWLKGNELLIIGYFMESHFNEDFIKQISYKGITGIITKKKFKKNITSNLIELLHEVNIPILIIEDKYSWSDIMTPIQSLIIKRQTFILKEAEKFHQAMIQTLSNQHSFHNLCTSLGQMTGFSLAIMDPSFHLLDFSNDFDWMSYTQYLSTSPPKKWQPLGKNKEGHRQGGYIEHQSDCPNSNIKLFLLPIFQQKKLVNYLVLKQNYQTKQLSSEMLAKLDSIQSIYLLKKAFYNEFQKANNHYHNLVFEEMIQMRKQNDEKLTRYSISLGLHLEKNYRLIMIDDFQEPIERTFTQKNDNFILFKEDICKQPFMNSSVLVFYRKNSWVILLPSFFINKDSFLNDLSNYVKEYLNHSNFAIGISDEHPYWQIYSAWKQAKQAIQFLRSNGNNKFVQYYEHLGIMKMFLDEAGNINQLYINQILSSYLYPLQINDKQHNTELVRTLEVFFDNGFSHVNTSNALFIHKNSLRARLKRIEEILDIDLKKSNDLMNLHIALKLWQLMD